MGTQQQTENNYPLWEELVTQSVADKLEVGYSDAPGIVESQPFYMQQSWAMGMTAEQTSHKVIAEATRP